MWDPLYSFKSKNNTIYSIYYETIRNYSKQNENVFIKDNWQTKQCKKENFEEKFWTKRLANIIVLYAQSIHIENIYTNTHKIYNLAMQTVDYQIGLFFGGRGGETIIGFHTIFKHDFVTNF